MSKYIRFQRQMVEVMDTLHFLLRQDQSILAHRRKTRGMLKKKTYHQALIGFEKDPKVEAIMLNVLRNFSS